MPLHVDVVFPATLFQRLPAAFVGRCKRSVCTFVLTLASPLSVFVQFPSVPATHGLILPRVFGHSTTRPALAASRSTAAPQRGRVWVRRCAGFLSGSRGRKVFHRVCEVFLANRGFLAKRRHVHPDSRATPLTPRHVRCVHSRQSHDLCHYRNHLLLVVGGSSFSSARAWLL